MDLTDHTIAVTGANGFVGARVCATLAGRGATVRAMVRRAGTAPTGDGITEVIAAPDDQASVAAAFGGATDVVHCFAVAGPDLPTAIAVNVDATRRLTDAAAVANVRRFVHVSTTSVNADDAPVVNEDAAIVDDTANAYSVSKRDGESVIAEAHAGGLPTVVLRPPAVLGWAATSTWGQKVPAWVKDGELPWQPDARANLGWVHVDDFADAVALSIIDDRAIGRLYTVTNGTTTWGEYLGEVMRWFPGCKDPFVQADEAPAARRWSSQKITEELGWAPSRTFDHAMTEAAAHHR